MDYTSRLNRKSRTAKILRDSYMTSKTIEAYQAQLLEKQIRLTSLLESYYPGTLDIFESQAKHYRMRAEFRVWHQGDETFHIMFDQQTKEKYQVNSLDAASRSINEAMQLMLEALKGNDILRKKLYQIDYLCTTSNEMLVSLIYHKTLDDLWHREISKLRQRSHSFKKLDFIGRS